eukprot:TRINITY_DN24254_c0_g1_i1.p1 TRINITY_DN24254_c0_g1~~TRINITY_DN24254_c0_g1_i1.p1  ORF type:complete len:483 (-),score=77.68 TRINITY_DN24254_c0_g1_i1:70-1350(-)
MTWLLQDNYEKFTLQQTPDQKMSKEVWEGLQQFVRWTRIKEKPELVHAAMVFIAIKGLGKAKQLVRQLPDSFAKPEVAVEYMLRRQTHMVPSTFNLSNEMSKLIADTLEVSQVFVFGQFLQAENSPFDVALLQGHLDRQGDPNVLRFWLFVSLSFMSGLGGGEGGVACHGSLFLNELNGRMLLHCLKSLQQVEVEECLPIYWSYLVNRARHLALPTTAAEEIALARLCILCRAQAPQDFQPVKEAFASLDRSDTDPLMEFLLADGIHETAIVFSFLPLCIANAKANVTVGLRAMLALLAEIIRMMRNQIRGSMGSKTAKKTTVDLSDLAAFIGNLKHSSVFADCMEHASLSLKDRTWVLSMTHKNWVRVDDEASSVPKPSFEANFKEILKNQALLENSVGERLHSVEHVLERRGFVLDQGEKVTVL